MGGLESLPWFGLVEKSKSLLAVFLQLAGFVQVFHTLSPQFVGP